MDTGGNECGTEGAGWCVWNELLVSGMYLHAREEVKAQVPVQEDCARHTSPRKDALHLEEILLPRSPYALCVNGGRCATRAASPGNKSPILSDLHRRNVRRRKSSVR